MTSSDIEEVLVFALLDPNRTPGLGERASLYAQVTLAVTATPERHAKLRDDPELQGHGLFGVPVLLPTTNLRTRCHGLSTNRNLPVRLR